MKNKLCMKWTTIETLTAVVKVSQHLMISVTFIQYV